MIRRGILLMLILVAFAFAGCGEKYGLGVDPGAPVAKVKDLILNPELNGKTVTLSGKINTQCVSNGCWFFLQDETGQVFVNLQPGNFTLPPRMGKDAKVTGIVARSQEGVELVAKGVTVR